MKQYNANRLTKITRPGSFSILSYNSGNILTSIVHSNANSMIDQNIYSYDQRNIPIQKRTLAGNFDYSYDLSGQLTASNTPVINESFSYDGIGNRTSDQSGSYSYNASRKLIEQDYNYTYSHDNNGNMIGKFSKALGGDKFNFSYTSLNQLKEVKIYTSDNTLKKTINYYFDPQGRRIKKAFTDHLDSSKSFSKFFIYDNENIIAEYNESGTMLASFTHSSLSPDDILATEITSDGQSAGLAQASGKFYYLKDHLGSVDVITDRLGNIIQKYQYSSFGKVMNVLDNNNSIITNNPKLNTTITYTGREFDQESGLYFYRARVYDANIGRFLQQDPDPGKLTKPEAFNNKYTYVNNIPSVLKDPTGKFAILAPIIIGAIIGATIGAIDAIVNGGNFFERVLRGAIGGALFGAAFYFSPVAATIGLTSLVIQSGSQSGNFFKNFNDNIISSGAMTLAGSVATSVLQTMASVPAGQTPTGINYGAGQIAAILGGVGTVGGIISLNNAVCDPEKGSLYSSDICLISRTMNGN